MAFAKEDAPVITEAKGWPTGDAVADEENGKSDGSKTFYDPSDQRSYASIAEEIEGALKASVAFPREDQLVTDEDKGWPSEDVPVAGEDNGKLGCKQQVRNIKF